MSGRYFRLFACCIAVRGARRSTICDLQRQTIQPIPNGLYDILTDHRDHTLDQVEAAFGPDDAETVREYFDFLVKNELGFWTDDPNAFPDLDLTWDAPELITNAVIDVGTGSRHDFASLFHQLDDLRCKQLQLRYFVTISPDALDAVLSLTARGRLRGVEVMVPWSDAWTADACLALATKHGRLHRIFVHSSPAARVIDGVTEFKAVFRREVIDSHAHCGQVSPAYFTSNLALFTEAQTHNSCLNRKMAVDEHGEIRNCPSLPQSFGNATATSLHAALLKQGFKDLWQVNKDQVDVCKDCEFRYVCTDCRAFIRDPNNRYSKPSKCGYDPYTAEWSRAPSTVAAQSRP